MYTVKIFHHFDRQLIHLEACTINIPEFQLVLHPPVGSLQLLRVFSGTWLWILMYSSHLDTFKVRTHMLWWPQGDHFSDHDEEEDKEGKERLEKRDFSNEDPVACVISITLDNPSGNLFLEFMGSMSDLKWNMCTYECSLEQNQQLGLKSPAEDKEENAVDEANQ
jgi:zinc finger protein